MRTSIILYSLILSLACLASCAPSASRAPYPEDGLRSQALAQQRDFVESFLQGRWCEAQALHAECMESFIRADDFCGAARAARLAVRLKAYLGLPAPQETAAAQRLGSAAAGTGGSCAGLAPGHETPRDARYGALVRGGRFAELARALEQEPDALFVSVYARKGAARALEQNDAQAETLWELARATDAAQGWVAFLRQDWQLRLDMEQDIVRRQAIHERIRILDEHIVPCP